MKRFLVGALLGLSLVSSCATDEVTTVSSEATASSRYLVVFRSEQLPKDAATKISKAGGKLVRKLDAVGLAVFSGSAAAADKLGKDAGVLAIGKEHAFRLRVPHAKQQSDMQVFDWALNMQWDMRRIGAPALWQRGLPRASTVAVLDTGVMYDHEDLAANIVDSRTTSYCNSDTTGYPVYDQVADLTIQDCRPNDGDHYPPDAFHGTHVSGTIASPINGLGIVGVSPTTGIASYRVFDWLYDGQGYFMSAFDFPIFDAIVDAVNRGHKVINMSLGGELDRSLRDHNAAWLAWSRVTSWAYRNGTLIVAAAGNETTNNNGTTAFIPSDLPSVMSVSATGTNQLLGNGWAGEEVNAAPGSDVLTFYSNYGAAVDIAAPGGDCGPTNDCGQFGENLPHLILSTCPWPNNIDLNTGEVIAPVATGYNSVYCWAAGTSMAAPHVAGVAAAARAVRPTLTAGETRSLLKSTAFAMGGRQGFGAGIVNADAATK